MHIKEINFKNRVCNYYFDDLIKAKVLKAKDISINEKNYKDLVIEFTRYLHSNLINMLSLHYHELMGKIEEHEGKNYLMVNEVLDNIKEIIGIEKLGNTEILIDPVDKLPDDITLKNNLILIKCFIKDDGKFYPQMFLEEALLVA